MLGGGDICKRVSIIVTCIEKHHTCISANMFLHGGMYGDVHVRAHVLPGVHVIIIERKYRNTICIHAFNISKRVMVLTLM